MTAQVLMEETNGPVGSEIEQLISLEERIIVRRHDSIIDRADITSPWTIVEQQDLFTTRISFQGGDRNYYLLSNKDLYVFDQSNIEWLLVHTFDRFIYSINVDADGNVAYIEDLDVLIHADLNFNVISETRLSSEFFDIYDDNLGLEQRTVINAKENTFIIELLNQKNNRLKIIYFRDNAIIRRVIPPRGINNLVIDNDLNLYWSQSFGFFQHNFSTNETLILDDRASIRQLAVTQENTIIRYYNEQYQFSNDGGITWTNINPVTIKPNPFEKIFAGIDNYFLMGSPTSTTIEFAEYEFTNDTPQLHQIDINENTILSIETFDDKIIAIAQSNHSLVSVDDGNSWQLITCPEEIITNKVSEINGQWYAADQTGIYQSPDSQTWSRISTFETDDFIKGFNNEIAFLNTDQIKIINAETGIETDIIIPDPIRINLPSVRFHPNGSLYFVNNRILYNINLLTQSITEVIVDLPSVNRLNINSRGNIITYNLNYSSFYNIDITTNTIEELSTIDGSLNKLKYRNGRYFLFNQSKFFVSEDNCRSWVNIRLSNFNPNDVRDFDIDNDNFLYIGLYNGSAIKSVIPIDLSRRIFGTIYNDTNDNCTFDNEIGLINQELTFESFTGEINHVLVGTTPYSVGLAPESYRIRLENTPDIWESCESEYTILQTNSGLLDI